MKVFINYNLYFIIDILNFTNESIFNYLLQIYMYKMFA